MCLHVTVLMIHTVVILLTQMVTVYTFIKPSPQNNLILNISRITLFFSQSLSQVIVIYLFVQFSKPQGFVKAA